MNRGMLAIRMVMTATAVIIMAMLAYCGDSKKNEVAPSEPVSDGANCPRPESIPPSLMTMHGSRRQQVADAIAASFFFGPSGAALYAADGAPVKEPEVTRCWQANCPSMADSLLQQAATYLALAPADQSSPAPERLAAAKEAVCAALALKDPSLPRERCIDLFVRAQGTPLPGEAMLFQLELSFAAACGGFIAGENDALANALEQGASLPELRTVLTIALSRRPQAPQPLEDLDLAYCRRFPQSP